MSQSPQQIIASGVGTIATIKVAGVALKQLESIGKPYRSSKKNKPY